VKTTVSFGLQLKTFLNKNNYSQTWLAKKAGLAEGAMNNIVRDLRPPSDNFLNAILAVPEIQALGLTMETLKAWKALDKFSPDILAVAVQQTAHELTVEQRQALISTLLGLGEFIKDDNQ
jgi:transcriptional regulator with XRE-family HTH domain